MSETSLFRSQEMSLVQVSSWITYSSTQLYIPMEIAQQTVSELGEVGLLQFRDVNTLYSFLKK